MGGNKCLGRDDGCGQPAFHIAGATPIDLAVEQRAAERVLGPAMPDLDHVDMAVEMHTFTRPCTVAPRDNVPAGVCVAVARRAMRADQLRREP